MSDERLGSQVAAVAAGGALGALARYGLTVAWPVPIGDFPWNTFIINVVGCLLIGVLMVLVTEVFLGRRLVRPFLGVGVLGGFTTFSTYAVEVRSLPPVIALSYLFGTLLAALAAVVAGVWFTRMVARR